MKILLVNDNGQTMAQMDDVEKFDASQPGHTAELLDLLEALIDSAKSSKGGIDHSVHRPSAGEFLSY